jgi:hypothetical protein
VRNPRVKFMLGILLTDSTKLMPQGKHILEIRNRTEKNTMRCVKESEGDGRV